MNLEPTYSATAVEAMFLRGFGDRLTPAIRAQLKDVGLDLDRPVAAAYPQVVFDTALQRATAGVFASLPSEEGHFETGRLYMKGFTDTLVGRAVVQLGKLIGPERTLGRMQRNQRTTNSYATLQLEKLGPTHFLLHSGVEAQYLPGIKLVPGFDQGAFLRGIYFAVLGLLEVRNPKVACRPIDPEQLRFDYELSWDP